MNSLFFKRLVIFVSIIGILLLILFSKTYVSKTLDLTKDNSESLEKVVIVCGNLKQLELKNNNLFFKICDRLVCLDAVIFSISKKEYTTLNSNYLNYEKICLKGKYTIYNSEPELIVYNFEKT